MEDGLVGKSHGGNAMRMKDKMESPKCSVEGVRLMLCLEQTKLRTQGVRGSLLCLKTKQGNGATFMRARNRSMGNEFRSILLLRSVQSSNPRSRQKAIYLLSDGCFHEELLVAESGSVALLNRLARGCVGIERNEGVVVAVGTKFRDLSTASKKLTNLLSGRVLTEKR